MNKILKITTLLFAIFISLSSCKKDKTTPASNDDYFVKYVIKGNGPYTLFNEFSVMTDKGKVSFSGYQYRSWTETYGPVKKVFRASITVKSTYVTSEIHISKNNGPFVKKASKSDGDVTYTIDF